VRATTDGPTRSTHQHQHNTDDEHDHARRPEDADLENETEEQEKKSGDNHAHAVPDARTFQTSRIRTAPSRPVSARVAIGDVCSATDRGIGSYVDSRRHTKGMHMYIGLGSLLIIILLIIILT
jgi:hypothetical protein